MSSVFLQAPHSAEMLWLAAAALVMVTAGGRYSIQKVKNSVSSLCLKAGATSAAVLTAWAAACRSQSRAAWLVVAAAVCCMIADVLLEVKFTAGSALFGVGHLFFMASYFTQAGPSAVTALVFGILFGGMYLLHRGQLFVLGKKKAAACLYSALLSAMTAMALTAAVQNRDVTGWMTGAGASCFFLSDNILIKRRLTGSRSQTMGRWILVFYYGALYLITAGQLLFKMR